MQLEEKVLQKAKELVKKAWQAKELVNKAWQAQFNHKKPSLVLKLTLNTALST